MYKKLVGIVVLGLLIATALPVVGTMTEKEKPLLSKSHIFNTGVNKGYTEVTPKGVVLWDNGMHYINYVASQWDPTIPFEAAPADDFQFEETTVVTDVHWIGGYFNPAENGTFDWNVSFYMDRGDGWAPGDKIYQEVFPNAMVHETFIEEIWDGLFFSYWVDLADAITFTGGEKYWISIQGVGVAFPQSHWSLHIPIVLHEGVFRSPYFGYPDWTNFTEVPFFGYPFDCCFQLTGDGEPVVPDLECDGELNWDQVPPGATVNSTFTVINSGDVGSMLEWEVLSKPEWGTNWSINWTFMDWTSSYDYGFVGTTTPEEVFVEVTAPDEKNKEFTGEIKLVNSNDASDTCSINVIINTPRSRATHNIMILHWLFEQFPNLFPILRQLLGL